MGHLRLALGFAAVGFVFTSRQWLAWLHQFGPETGLFIKYVAIVSTVLFLDFIDPTLKLEHKTQALGALLVFIAFNLIFNYQSELIDDYSRVEIQTPDGALYHRAKTTLGLSPEMARIATFVLVPFVLVFFGSRLVRNGQKINLE